MASGLRKLDALSVNKWEKASSFHSGLWCFNNITSNKQKHLLVETPHVSVHGAKYKTQNPEGECRFFYDKCSFFTLYVQDRN